MSKLYQLSDTLSAVEKREFDKYLASPFFNSDKSGILLRLWTLMKNGGKKRPSDTDLAHQLYPDKTDADKGAAFVRKAKSELGQLLLQFLGHSLLLKQTYNIEQTRLLSLSKHGLTKEYEAEWLAQKNVLESNTCPSVADYQADYELHGAYYNYLLLTNNRHPDANKLRLSVIRKFDLYYAGTQIAWVVNLLSGNNIIYPLSAQESEKTQKDAAALLTFIETKGFLSEPVIAAYYHLAHLFLQKKTETHLIALQEWLNKYAPFAKHQDLVPLCKFACNYCIGKYTKAGFLEHTNFFYETRLKWQLLPEENHFVPADFKNIVSLKCHLQKTEEAKQFVEKYSPLLPPEHAYLVNYVRGQIAFYDNDFKAAVQYLEQVEKKDNIDYLQVSRLLIKSYFGLVGELRYNELLENKLNAMKTRIYQMERQKNITAHTKEEQLVFVAHCEKLFFILENSNSRREKIAALSKLQEEIQNMHINVEKQWFLDYCKKEMDGK